MTSLVQTIAVRDRVRRNVAKKTGELYGAIIAEINTVKRLLDGVKRVPERSAVLPPRAAQANRARTLSRRLECMWEVLQRVQVRVLDSRHAFKVLCSHAQGVGVKSAPRTV